MKPLLCWLGRAPYIVPEVFNIEHLATIVVPKE
jgi:hypothetical protein